MPYTDYRCDESHRYIPLLFTFILIFAALKQNSDPAENQLLVLNNTTLIVLRSISLRTWHLEAKNRGIESSSIHSNHCSAWSLSYYSI